MPIPTQTEMFKFTLQQMKPGIEYSRRYIKDRVCEALELSNEEQMEKTGSGVPLYESRVGWAISWLNDGKYIERVSRGVYRMTASGKAVLEENLSIDDFAGRLYAARAKEQLAKANNETKDISDLSIDTELTSKVSPEELLSAAESSFREELAEELMAAIMDISGRNGDTFFEQLVTDLLVHMGYGEGSVTPASNDGGVDGIIKTDPLGFDPIFIQAKRYSPDNVISRSAIQAFAGALGSITRGAFITTSSFQQSAIEFAKTYPHADIVLIDGTKLTNLMIEYDLGVTPEREIKIKRLDTDYFNRDE